MMLKIDERIRRKETLKQEAARLKTIEDFERYMALLTEAWNDGVFEPQSVNEYLNGIWGVIEGTPELTDDGEPTPASWPFFAETLLKAFVHS